MNYDISINIATWPPKYEFLATPPFININLQNYVIKNYSDATVDQELYCENALLFDSLSILKA